MFAINQSAVTGHTRHNRFLITCAEQTRRLGKSSLKKNMADPTIYLLSTCGESPRFVRGRESVLAGHATFARNDCAGVGGHPSSPDVLKRMLSPRIYPLRL
jgi:hypothetical protein